MNLDDAHILQTLDTQNVIGSIRALPDQIKQTWDDVHALTIPEEMKSVNKIVFSGMGGSGLGASVVKHLYGLQMNVPFEIINGYTLPAYVDENTLVMIQTYSGTTEESLQCYEQALQKTKHIFTLASGSTLEEVSQQNNSLHFKIEPKFNPSNQPRMGVGYSVFGSITFLHRLGFVHVSEEELNEIDALLRSRTLEYDSTVPTDTNRAKQIAFNLHERIPVLVSSEHIVGATHVTRNQIHENAKQFAEFFPVPELNHHLLEGLTFPKITHENDNFVFYMSDLYHDRNQKRMQISQDVVQKAGHNTEMIKLTGSTKLVQVIEAIQIGAYYEYYMALLNGIDPAPIPTVDYFKKMLA